MILPAPLAATATALRSDQLDLLAYIDDVCNRIDAIDSQLQALLPETERRGRLRSEAMALQQRFPDAASRPPLYGIPVGVKDMFRVAGFPTRAGSQLPPELFAGPEAACVTALREAGALIVGKTVTTEFAYFEPGPTRNPHNLKHTPGGSSSGSAAAVAAGFCPLALGTQVIGSTIRPAAYCGIVGFKPSYGRIPKAGLIESADSVEHVGYFTQDVAGIALVAPLLCGDWRPVGTDLSRPDLSRPSNESRRDSPDAITRSLQSEIRPVLGVLEGPYLSQASAEALSAFERQLTLLQKAGYSVRRVNFFIDIEEINQRHTRLVFAEMASIHASWFRQYEALYRPRTAAAIREGQTVGEEEQERAREGRAVLRSALASLMEQAGIDMWVCPATTGPAPEGLDSTGSPIMNLPWTYSGLPAITVPAGRAANGLPLGLQCVGAAMNDELLVTWAAPIAEIFVNKQETD